MPFRLLAPTHPHGTIYCLFTACRITVEIKSRENRDKIVVILPVILGKTNALVAQWIRALACGARGRVFESRRGRL